MADELPKWKCEFQGEESGLVRNTPATVGEVLQLKCEGSEAEFNPEKLKIVLVGKDKSYALKLLKVQELSPTGARLDVTSYEVGEHKDVSLVLTDGDSFVALEPLTWNVRTVIDTSQGQPEPFGPFGPWKITWPWWYWVGAILIFVVVMGFLIARIRYFLRRRKLIKEVDEYRRKFSAFDELQRDLRQYLKRVRTPTVHKQELLEQLEEQFRLYLMREFYIYTKEGSSSALLSRLKTTKKLKVETLQETHQLLRELDRAHRPDLLSEDLEHLIEWVQELSEELDSQSRGSK